MAHESIYHPLHSIRCLAIFLRHILNVRMIIHCLWECPKIQKFWTEIIKCLSEVFNVKIPLCSKLCVLGIYPESFTQTNKATKCRSTGNEMQCMLVREKKGLCAPLGTLHEHNNNGTIGISFVCFVV